MIPPPAQRPAPPRRGWWLLVALVFILQLGFIFGLGGYLPVRPRPAQPAPRLRLAGPAAGEWLALNDPTLFALPHAHGFSGPAWLKIPSLGFPSREWSEPPLLLPLAVADLGVGVSRLAGSIDLGSLAPLAQTAPELTLPAVAPPLRPGPSTFRFEGALARRPLLTPLSLTNWPCRDLLTNSVVQLVVDPAGRPVSVTLLSTSGYKEADDRALELAAAARFAPVPGSEPGKTLKPATQLTWGKLIIQWQTLPLPAADASPGGP